MGHMDYEHHLCSSDMQMIICVLQWESTTEIHFFKIVIIVIAIILAMVSVGLPLPRHYS